MSKRPEELLLSSAGPDAVVLIAAIDDPVAYVVGKKANGDICSITAEHSDGKWRFIGGGAGNDVGFGWTHISWCRSYVFPPGVLGVARRSAVESVVVDYDGQRITVAVRDGWCAWVRGGVGREPVPVLENA